MYLNLINVLNNLRTTVFLIVTLYDHHKPCALIFCYILALNIKLKVHI